MGALGVSFRIELLCPSEAILADRPHVFRKYGSICVVFQLCCVTGDWPEKLNQDV